MVYFLTKFIKIYYYKIIKIANNDYFKNKKYYFKIMLIIVFYNL